MFLGGERIQSILWDVRFVAFQVGLEREDGSENDYSRIIK